LEALLNHERGRRGISPITLINPSTHPCDRLSLLRRQVRFVPCRSLRNHHGLSVPVPCDCSTTIQDVERINIVEEACVDLICSRTIGGEDCDTWLQHGHQFAAVAFRFACGYSYSTTAACTSIAVIATVAEQACNTPATLEDTIRSQSTNHVVAAATGRSPADPLAGLRPCRKRRKGDAWCYKHAAVANFSARCAHDPSQSSVSTAIDAWYGHIGR